MSQQSTSPGGSRIARFGIVGAVNTAVGLAVLGLTRHLGAGPHAANATGLLAGLVTSFVLNRNWTFRHSAAWPMTATRFLLAFLVSWLVNAAVLALGLRVALLPEAVAQLAAIVVYATVFYMLCLHVVFRERS